MAQWDPRVSQRICDIDLNSKIVSITKSGDRLVVATMDRKVHLVDIRATTEILSIDSRDVVVKDSPLKLQTRNVTGFADGQGYVVASVEVSVD
mgnify:CR=1 FL=1